MDRKFDECPNCGHKPSSIMFGSLWMYIYQCDNCESYFCHDCTNSDKDCPNCGSSDKSKVGECWEDS
jgi:DNA-directed RNA polymerase subunit RPC12/RpoP